MTSRFLRNFFLICWQIRSVFFLLCSLIIVCAAAISEVEKLPFGDTLYFASITALTIGYGDIVPHSVIGRLISVCLGIVGILFTGLIVGVTVRSVADALSHHKQHPD